MDKKTKEILNEINQQFYYLTEFYTDEIETRALNVTNEWRIDRQGSILGNGLPFILRA